MKLRLKLRVSDVYPSGLPHKSHVKLTVFPQYLFILGADKSLPS